MKRALFAAVLLVAAALSVGPVFAQYGGTQGFLIDPASVLAGERVNFLGTGCGPSRPVVFIIRETSTILAETVTNSDSDGSFFVGGVVIPVEVPPGTYTVEARCGNSRSNPGPPRDRVLTATLVVLEPPAAAGAGNLGRSSPGSLAFTGNRSAGTALKAGLLLIAGGTAALVVRRRKNTEHSPVY